MRASEFIFEATADDGSHGKRKGKLHPDVQSAMGMIHRVAGTADRTYDLNRAMMAVASSNGKEFSHVPTGESWVARSNMAAPYTKEEHDMLHHAYGAIGTPVQSATDDHRREPDDTHRISPVKGFKGY
tara:strand:+ start:179 stop:562 length:384 start_codon:yes stop_codon:yes gene_type:complete